MRDLLLGTLYSSLQTSASLATAKSLLQGVVKRGPSLEAEKWLLPFALYELAVVECKEGDIAEKATPSGGQEQKSAEVKQVWKERLKKAEATLEQVFLSLEYDLKSRLESRVIMLRDELGTKRKMIGL